MVQNFREIAGNPININFCDKNFVIATFFFFPETTNLHDPFAAVKVLKTDEIVSHLPKRISSLCSSSVSESKHTDSEPSLAAIQHFTFTIMYIRVC